MCWWCNGCDGEILCNSDVFDDSDVDGDTDSDFSGLKADDLGGENSDEDIDCWC